MDNKWEMLESSNEDREKIWKKNRTFAGDVWYRFSHKPTSIAGFVIIVMLLFFALAGPLFKILQQKNSRKTIRLQKNTLTSI